jgi:predicted nuclease with TOPRIM domain
MDIEVQLPDPVRSNESNELIRERDFYRAKLEEVTARVKSLEFDCAELQKRDVELSKRLAEVANKSVNYRPHRRVKH